MLRTTLAVALCALLCLTSTAFAQITNIDDIQAYDATGAPASPLVGNVVTVRGVITMPAGVLNSGGHYVQDPTGGITFFSTSSGFALGDSVEVTGDVGSFNGSEIDLGTGSGLTLTFLGTSTVPAPQVYTVQQALDNDGSGTQTAADYEVIGWLASVTGDIAFLPDVAAPPWGGGTFQQGTVGLTDVSGDTLIVFVDGTTGIDATSMGNGDHFQITGILSPFNGLIELKPRYQTDLVKNPGDPYPVVNDITPSPWAPHTNEAVTVSATITDNGSISAATLYYAYGGSGSFSSVAMNNTIGDTYEATIPGTSMASIEYYILATDNSAQTTNVPGDAPASSLHLAVGTTSIMDIQSSVDGTNGSTYAGQLVNVEGIVTVAPGELNSPGSQWIIEDPEGGPWSGIFVYESSGSNVLFRGDMVRISGTISEFDTGTELNPQRGDAVQVLSYGNAQPPILAFTSTDLDTTEALEYVMVRSFMSTVVDTIAATDNYYLQDTVSDSLLRANPMTAVSLAPLPDDTQIATGLLDVRFGGNAIAPRDDNDLQLFATGIESGAPATRRASLTSIYPNPFNPMTQIEFNLPRKGMAELAIFNVKGERVRTLVNGVLDAGDQTRTWNGRDGSGAPVGSGVYYVRLRFETESSVVQKVTLLK